MAYADEMMNFCSLKHKQEYESKYGPVPIDPARLQAQENAKAQNRQCACGRCHAHNVVVMKPEHNVPVNNPMMMPMMPTTTQMQPMMMDNGATSSAPRVFVFKYVPVENGSNNASFMPQQPEMMQFGY